MTPGAREVSASTLSFASHDAKETIRALAVETPLELVFGTIPYAVMMVTPDDLEDFITGFAMTEGVIERASDIRSIKIETHPKGLRALIDLVPEKLSAHLARKRAMTGRTGCGVCGVEDLAALPAHETPLKDGARISENGIKRAIDSLAAHQPLNDVTRAVHAAAWFDTNGNFILAREDVGRHNALDKAIGALMRSATTPLSGFMVITSRASYEMIEKAARFGASTLVAISAPTSLAVERAEALGITLYAIARADGAMKFTNLAEKRPTETSR
jgi:FdhD protein